MVNTIQSKLGISQIINASGKMTILGGSIVSDEVGQALQAGSQNFYLMEELVEKTSADLANALELEALHFVSSASSGIAQSVAASIAQDRYEDILNPYREENTQREIIIAKGHIVDYGTSIEVPIRMGGGKIVEAGFANACALRDYEALINENTAAILYVVSHHAVQKSMAACEDVIKLGEKHEIPVIVDAAAESDLQKYVQMGASAVIYSGTKALEGPTSGLVVGTKTFIDYVRLQGQGIGRVMKVGKEAIWGLYTAVSGYLEHESPRAEEQKARLKPFNEAIENIEGLKTEIRQDAAGREIYRSVIHFSDFSEAQKVAERLKQGSVKVYTRDYFLNEGQIEIDIRDINDEELMYIHRRIQKEVEALRDGKN